MRPYKEYTLLLTLKAPLVTPFQSDTLFGHICWAVRFLFGEESGTFQGFLSAYDSMDTPPMLLSDGFPQGFLPMPIIPSIHPRDLDKVVGKDDRVKAAAQIKAVKEMTYVPKKTLSELMKEGPLAPMGLFERIYTQYKSMRERLNADQLMLVQHNAINRVTQETTGLHFQEERFFDKHGGIIEIYLRSSHFDKGELEQIFEFIGEQGYGKDKSTGKGHFSFEINEGIDLPEAENPNAFMTLSSYIPHPEAPTKGYYRLVHKYGKLGGTYAKGILGGNPFKKPLLMFAAGSTFYDKDFYSGKVYGSLLKDVHRDGRIRHYAYAFPLGITLLEVVE